MPKSMYKKKRGGGRMKKAKTIVGKRTAKEVRKRVKQMKK